MATKLTEPEQVRFKNNISLVQNMLFKICSDIPELRVRGSQSEVIDSLLNGLKDTYTNQKED